MPRVEIGVDAKGWTRLEAAYASLREERERRIAETDYLLAADYPISSERLEAVKAYRQALRDLPGLSGAPWDGGGSQTPWPTPTMAD